MLLGGSIEEVSCAVDNEQEFPLQLWTGETVHRALAVEFLIGEVKGEGVLRSAEDNHEPEAEPDPQDIS
jgi:hypothetical protein